MCQDFLSNFDFFTPPPPQPGSVRHIFQLQKTSNGLYLILTSPYLISISSLHLIISCPGASPCTCAHTQQVTWWNFHCLIFSLFLHLYFFINFFVSLFLYLFISLSLHLSLHQTRANRPMFWLKLHIIVNILIIS